MRLAVGDDGAPPSHNQAPLREVPSPPFKDWAENSSKVGFQRRKGL